jgi:hypothetical protein
MGLILVYVTVGPGKASNVNFFPFAEMYTTSWHTAFYCVTPLVPVDECLPNFMANSFVLPGTRNSFVSFV